MNDTSMEERRAMQIIKLKKKKKHPIDFEGTKSYLERIRISEGLRGGFLNRNML